MAAPENCTDVAKLTAFSKEKEENQILLESLYTSWEQLSEALDTL